MAKYERHHAYTASRDTKAQQLFILMLIVEQEHEGLKVEQRLESDSGQECSFDMSPLVNRTTHNTSLLLHSEHVVRLIHLDGDCILLKCQTCSCFILFSLTLIKMRSFYREKRFRTTIMSRVCEVLYHTSQ